MAGWVARKVHRRCVFKRKSSTASIVVEEAYLRDDLTCGSPLCRFCAPHLPHLPPDASHYLVPNADAILLFWEVFELAQFGAVIFLTSVLKEVQARSTQRGWRRLKSIFTDRRRCNIFFDDQHCVFTSLEFDGSSPNNVENIGQWFSDHLDHAVPLVVLTGFQQGFTDVDRPSGSITVLDPDRYFNSYWQHDQSVSELYGSLALAYAESLQAIDSAPKGGRGVYKEHLSATSLEEGIGNGSLRVGVFNVSKHATSEAFVRPSNKGEASRLEILVFGRAMQNRALHGDIVAVRVINSVLSEQSRENIVLEDETTAYDVETADIFFQKEAPFTGEVVGILQRTQRDYVACLAEEDESALMSSSRQRLLCIPMDRRIPMVELITRQGLRLSKQRFVVRIDSWEPDSKFPRGHLVRQLGPIGDLSAEMMAILVENGISAAPFSSLSLQELPRHTLDRPWTIPEEEHASRRDIRFSHRSCSIDPPGSKDVDDVLSVCRLGNGLVEVGVHIADVSYFLKHGSLLDLEARSRGTTVYMVGKSWHMLPTILSENLCSLLEGRDRLAVSVIWTLDLRNKLEVVGVWFGRTIIRSQHQLFYAQAEAILEKKHLQSGWEVKSDDPAELGRLQNDLSLLARFAQTRRSIRKLNGALELASAELRFEVDENKEPIRLETKLELPMNWIVAEMMIFANSCVAEKIYRTFRTSSLLRKHVRPKLDNFTMLLQCCEARGFVLDVSSNKALGASLDRMQESGDPVVERAFRALITRAMSEAEYFCTGNDLEPSDFYHYGLALEYYTHFTSPIRRYADVLVHRMLIAACQSTEVQDIKSPTLEPIATPDELQEIAEHLNEKHRASKRAQKECNQLYLLMYLQKRAKAESAVIINITSRGFIVFVPKYDLRGPVYLEDKDHHILLPEVDPVKAQETQEYQLVKQSGSIKIVNTATKRDFQEYKLMDTVWVRLRADGSRAHGPTLRIDLLSSNHPAVLSARAEEISSTMSRLDLFNATDEVKVAPASSRREAIEAMVEMVAAAEAGSTKIEEKQKKERPLTVADILENVLQAKVPSVYSNPPNLATPLASVADQLPVVDIKPETDSQQHLRKKWQESLARAGCLKAKLTSSTSPNESERQQSRTRRVAVAWDTALADRTRLHQAVEI